MLEDSGVAVRVDSLPSRLRTACDTSATLVLHRGRRCRCRCIHRKLALAELRRVLEAPGPYRTAVLQALTARPASAELATLIAMADTDEVVRLRLLRAIRDLGA